MPVCRILVSEYSGRFESCCDHLVHLSPKLGTVGIQRPTKTGARSGTFQPRIPGAKETTEVLLETVLGRPNNISRLQGEIEPAHGRR